MERLYLVDGYNFIIEDPDLSGVLSEDGLSAARRAFRDEVEAFAIRSGCRIRLIFDGATDPMSHDDRFDGERVEVSFTSRDEKADERLVAVALEARRRGDQPTIVSNDRAGIRDPLLIAGFPLVTTQQFARLIRDAGPRRERRADALSDSEKMALADQFLARDAERQRRIREAPAAPVRAAAAPIKPRPAATRPVPAPPLPSPKPATSPAADPGKKERGKRKQARRLALIQSRRKKR